MKEISLEKCKVRDLLAERLTKQILQLDEHVILSLISIGRDRLLREEKSDTELFIQLVETISEFQLMKLVKADLFTLFVTVREENETE